MYCSQLWGLGVQGQGASSVDFWRGPAPPTSRGLPAVSAPWLGLGPLWISFMRERPPGPSVCPRPITSGFRGNTQTVGTPAHEPGRAPSWALPFFVVSWLPGPPYPAGSPRDVPFSALVSAPLVLADGWRWGHVARWQQGHHGDAVASSAWLLGAPRNDNGFACPLRQQAASLGLPMLCLPRSP